MTYRRAHDIETLFLILKNQSIWPIKITLLYMWIQDSFKGYVLFIGYEPFIKKVLALEVLEVLEKDIKVLTRKETIKEDRNLKLKTLVNIPLLILISWLAFNTEKFM